MKSFLVGDVVVFLDSHHADIKPGIRGIITEIHPSGYAVKVTSKFLCGHYPKYETLTRTIFAFSDQIQLVVKQTKDELTEPIHQAS